MLKNMTSERATVLTSAVVAIAILGAAVTAQPSRTTATERLERLVSDLRYQLELQSRVEPAKVELQRQALDQVLQAWKESQQSESDYKMIVAWLKTTIRASMPGESGQWPAAPAFSSPQPAVASDHEVRKDAVNTPAVEAPHAKADTPPHASPSKETHASPLASPSRKSVEKGLRPFVAKPQVQGKADQTKPIIVHVSDPVPTGAETLINDKPPAAPAAMPAVDASPVEASAVVTAERPAPTPEQTTAAYEEPPLTLNTSEPAPQPAVEVNLAELNARIGGYHDGLREVEAALVASREGMTEGELTKLVARLEELAGQYEFIQLYYGSLTRDERHFAIEPRAISETVKLVDRKRELVELLSADDHFAAADETGESELAQRLRALLEFAAKPGKECCGGRP